MQTQVREAPQPPNIEMGGQGAFYEHPVAKCLFFYIDPEWYVMLFFVDFGFSGLMIDD